jgi:NAD(P)-dependent dehydrogenase (short-subunit alcohol dehydrogenase family)
MARWTADDIPDLSGKVAVVTGANSGLGFETALELARHGAEVVLACRDERRGNDALERCRAACPDGRDRVQLSRLDLADLSSVRDFAKRHAGEHDGLDILVNNAGVMALDQRRTTADGFEMQFGTNHLGHFALTGLLLPSLLARPGARVVSVSSGAHRFGKIDFDDLQAEQRYRKWRVYGQSKLANVLFAFELDRRAQAAGASLVSAVAHPGYAATNLQTDTRFAWSNRFFAQSAAMGALPQLHAATAPGVAGGDFYGPDRLFEQRGHPRKVKAQGAAFDTEVARRLWEVSEQLTGVQYAL